MAVIIGHASIDERGKANSGQAGDLSGPASGSTTSKTTTTKGKCDVKVETIRKGSKGGEFKILSSGETQIDWSGGVTSVEITQRGMEL